MLLRSTSVAMCAAIFMTAYAFTGPSANTMADSNAPDDYQYYKRDENVGATNNALNQEIASEGMVMLKNDGLLPLTKEKHGGNEIRVSVFGKHSVQLVDRGFGSSDTFYGTNNNLQSILDSSDTFAVNPVLKEFYENTSKSGQFRLNGDYHGSMDNYKAGLSTWETPQENYNRYPEIAQSYKDYNDAAIVVLSRYAGEGNDLPTTSLKSWDALDDSNKLDSARSWDSHYLQLDKYEVDMLQSVMANFDNVIVLVNSANPFELGFLNDPEHYLYTDNEFTTTTAEAEEMMGHLKAAFHIGFPGSTGALAIPELLDGTVNPSGHLADTWAVNFMNNPVMDNFGYNGSGDGNKSVSGVEYVHYDEDIYVGYRYYETRYFTEGGDDENGNAWYDAEVMYPFGYGLSYTTFDWELLRDQSTAENTPLEKDGVITTTVRVTNMGNVAGKDAVQLYYNAPYYENGISKAHVVLSDFAKTKLLQPGESETITFTTDVSEMYSYDWSDANGNGFKGYELDSGTYNIIVAQDAHEAAKIASHKRDNKEHKLALSYLISEGYQYAEDTTTGAAVSNLFDDVSGTGRVNAEDFMGVHEYATRENGFKTTPAADKKNIEQIINTPTVTPEYDEGKPWYSDTMPDQAENPGTAETNEVKLWHLIGRDYDDPLWDELLDQLSYSEMVNLIGLGFSHTEAIPSIDKPQSVEWDGPLGRRNSSEEIQWVTNTLLGQTFNKELANRQGVQFGNAGLTSGQTGGTYGIGLNTHRSPFGGRNFEYYSEDPILSGYMAAEVLKGTNSKGTYHTLKHFVVNDQETARNNVQTWLSEQALREIYAKPFEIAVKEGGANAIMGGVNQIGATNCSESWALMTGLLRNEWGFEGFVITDLLAHNADRCIRAGTDLMMSMSLNAPSTDAASLTPTQATAIRNATKNILYVMANSNVMNGYGGEPLNHMDYGGVSTLYAVEGVDNTLSVNKATSTLFDDGDIVYSMLEGSQLPEGMSLSADGHITGAPAEAGEYKFTVVANENVSEKVMFPSAPEVKNYTLRVYSRDNLPETIIYEDDDLGIIPYGYAYSKSIAGAVAFDADGKLITDIKYSLTEDSELPEGLTLNDGVISGTTVANPGTYFFTVKAESSGREPAYLDFIVTVKAYSIDYSDPVTIGEYEVGDTVAINVGTATSNDNIDIGYSLKEGSVLPEGLTLSNTGMITGTLARAYTGHKFTVVAQADMAAPREVTYSMTVKGIEFSDSDLGQVILGKDYSFNLGAALNDGGSADIFYSVKEGSTLPSGMYLLADGTLFGTPDEIGKITFTVVATADGYVPVEADITLNIEEIYEDVPDGEVSEPIETRPADGSGCAASFAPASFAGMSGVLALCAVMVICGGIVRKKKD